MMYSEAVMTRFMHPHHAGQVIANPLQSAYQATVGAQDQGALLQLFIQVNTQTQCVSAATFQMYGCGACIATADMLCERLIGLNLKQMQGFNTQELAVALELPMVKMHCTWLANEALEKITTAWQSANASHL